MSSLRLEQWDGVGSMTVEQAVVPSPGEQRNRCTLMMLAPIQGPVFALKGPEIVLGRNAQADVTLEDAGLSRMHARLFWLIDGFWIDDLGSRNGTFVDGERVTSPRRLTDGNRLQLGRNVCFRFHLHDESEQEAAHQLYEAAVRDALTKVFNRRYLQQQLVTEHAFAARHGAPLSVLMLDIDHFKGINDTHGHGFGDRVLHAVAHKLDHITRVEDVVARYGGEEFCIIARGVDVDGARALAERCRAAVEALRVRTDQGQAVPVTLSIGVATQRVGTTYESCEALVEAADGALYRAKREGRNRACVALPEPVLQPSWMAR